MSVALGSCERIYRYGFVLVQEIYVFSLCFTRWPRFFRFFSHEVPASRAFPACRAFGCSAPRCPPVRVWGDSGQGYFWLITAFPFADVDERRDGHAALLGGVVARYRAQVVQRREQRTQRRADAAVVLRGIPGGCRPGRFDTVRNQRLGLRGADRQGGYRYGGQGRFRQVEFGRLRQRTQHTFRRQRIFENTCFGSRSRGRSRIRAFDKRRGRGAVSCPGGSGRSALAAGRCAVAGVSVMCGEGCRSVRGVRCRNGGGDAVAGAGVSCSGGRRVMPRVGCLLSVEPCGERFGAFGVSFCRFCRNPLGPLVPSPGWKKSSPPKRTAAAAAPEAIAPKRCSRSCLRASEIVRPRSSPVLSG